MSARRRGAPSADQGPPRVVIDTNVVLSALVFGRGTTARLRAAWQGGHCLPLVSTASARRCPIMTPEAFVSGLPLAVSPHA